MQSDWKEKVVLITGAASGIGRAAAEAFSAAGAAVALLDRNHEGLLSAARAAGDASLVLHVDLQDETAVVEAVRKAFAWHGRLDAVVNVAGISPAEDFLQSSREDWDRLMQINLRGTFLVAREGARYMKEARAGAIVNVSSILAMVGDPSLVSYCATKGGISAMTRAMAVALAPCGVRVNAVCPGDVATPLLESWIEQQADPAATRATIASAYPLGHYCNPADVAAAILFLAGPGARCITGVDLPVDCGLTVKCY